MAGTSEGGRKAALTRGHKSLSEAGRKGGRNSHLNRKANAAASQSKSNHSDNSNVVNNAASRSEPTN